MAEPPAESPSTKNSSLCVLSLDCAGASFPDKERSFVLRLFPFLASSLARLAASLAILLFKDLLMISVATVLFSSKKTRICSETMFSTATRACGVPSFPFVCPSNCKIPSGIFRLMTAVKPSLTSQNHLFLHNH